MAGACRQHVQESSDTSAIQARDKSRPGLADGQSGGERAEVYKGRVIVVRHPKAP